MPDLITIVPTRGRPNSLLPLAEAFANNSTADTLLVVAVDSDDPDLERYRSAAAEAKKTYPSIDLVELVTPGNMATALNMATRICLDAHKAQAIGFMGDDHRPRTDSWDAYYLSTLAASPGIVFGNDLIHGYRLPTQFAVSWPIVESLRFLAPPGLKHMYIDNYWRDIGTATQTLTYLENVVVEHLHPVAAKAESDEGYERVNAPEIFDHDAKVYEQYMTANAARDIELIHRACAQNEG